MRNKILLCFLVLTGCATAPDPVVNTVVQKVEVPIAVPCSVKVPDVPILTFPTLNESQDIFDKSKALLSDRKLQLGYETDLLAALNSCVK